MQRMETLETGGDTHTHTSNLGFQLTQIVSLGRKVMEQQGEKVQRLELLKKGFTRAASCNAQAAENCGGKPVCGEGIVRNHHESNRKWKSLSNSFWCRYVSKRPC